MLQKGKKNAIQMVSTTFKHVSHAASKSIAPYTPAVHWLKDRSCNFQYQNTEIFTGKGRINNSSASSDEQEYVVSILIILSSMIHYSIERQIWNSSNMVIFTYILELSLFYIIRK